jgi:hypothetical protein
VYSYIVWNLEGQLALRNATASDDTCMPLVYRSGDINGNSILEYGENWSYSCAMTLYSTTTNIATAVGYGDNVSGLQVTASTSVTVAVGASQTPPPVVPITIIYPSLPDAGFEARELLSASESTLVALLIASATVAAFISKRRWSTLGKISS